MKKRMAFVAGSILAASALVPLLGTTTAMADVRDSQSLTSAAAQTSIDTTTDKRLIAQLDAAVNQWKKAHKDALTDSLVRTVVQFHRDVAREQAARNGLDATLANYTKVYKKDLGHDHGTIARTEPEMKRIVSTTRSATKDDRTDLTKYLMSAKTALSQHHLLTAILDVNNADRRLNDRTRTFASAAEKVRDIIAQIQRSVKR